MFMVCSGDRQRSLRFIQSPMRGFSLQPWCTVVPLLLFLPESHWLSFIYSKMPCHLLPSQNLYKCSFLCLEYYPLHLHQINSYLSIWSQLKNYFPWEAFLNIQICPRLLRALSHSFIVCSFIITHGIILMTVSLSLFLSK